MKDNPLKASKANYLRQTWWPKKAHSWNSIIKRWIEKKCKKAPRWTLIIKQINWKERQITDAKILYRQAMADFSGQTDRHDDL